jgi:hypothetical protein
MTSSDSEDYTLRRKNRVVVIALLCGLVVPFLYIAFLAEHLPDWLDTVIVGGVFWFCFVEIIPANTVGFFRRPEKRVPIQPPQRNAGSRPSSDDSSTIETPSSLGPRG